MIIKLAAAVFMAGLVWIGGLTKLLGAHPFWDDKVLWIGGCIAIAGLILTHRFDGWRLTLSAGVLALISYGVARYGKTAFAASYAEDQFAGQLWFFGWIAACAFLVWAVGSLSARLMRLG